MSSALKMDDEKRMSYRVISVSDGDQGQVGGHTIKRINRTMAFHRSRSRETENNFSHHIITNRPGTIKWTALLLALNANKSNLCEGATITKSSTAVVRH